MTQGVALYELETMKTRENDLLTSEMLFIKLKK